MDKATSCQTILAEPEGIIAYQRNKPLYDSVKELLRTDSAIAARGNTFSAKKDARARWNDSYTVKHLYDGVQRSTMDPAITAPSHPLSTGETQGSRALGEVNKTSDDVRWENRCVSVHRLRD